MAFGRPSPPLERQDVYGVFDTNWYIAPDLRFGGPALLFEHPRFGPVAFIVPPDQAMQIARALTLQSQVAARASTTAN